jgi:excisionase family DNA binding protein
LAAFAKEQNMTITPDAINRPLAVAPAEAARMLSIGKTRLYLMIGNKEIPVIKIGRRTLIRVRDIEAYLDRQQAEA